jgi:NAD(P)-dependent dehydrogenase (short-subunit alcohol dehydrogenase family)
MALEGRVIVIAGATGGLGRVVARELASGGMRTVLLGTDADRLKLLVEELNLPADGYMTRVVRGEDRETVLETRNEVLAKFGRVDALFNFVGGWLGGKQVIEVAPEELQTMLTQHVWTTFNLLQAFVPSMVENGWGRLVTVSAPNSGTPDAKRSAYAAAKAAQEALMLGLAKEVQGTGVTANVLVVVAIDAKHERDSVPTSRNALWTTPEEVTAMLWYLLSDEAHVVNGQRIAMYGR